MSEQKRYEASSAQSVEQIRLSWCASRCWHLVWGLALLLVVIGCAGEDPQLATLREQLLLQSEPTGVTTIAEAMAQLGENPSVLVAGQIQQDENEAFLPGQAAFVIREILPDETGHAGKQHADNCPFCKRKLKNAPLAVVRVLGDDGEVVQVDARQLLGVDKGDVVIVRGLATYLEPVNTVQIDAEGVFIR